MTTQLRNYLFSVRYNYGNPIDRQRARGILAVAGALLFVWIIFVGAVLVHSLSTKTSVTEIDSTRYLGVALIPLLIIGLYQLIQTGRLTTASFLLVAFLYASSSVATERLDAVTSTVLFPALIAATLLLGRRGLMMALFITIAFVLAGAISQAQLTAPPDQIPSDRVFRDVMVVVLMISLAILFLVVFSSNTQTIVDESLNEAEMFRRASQFSVELSTDTQESQVYVRILNTLRTITSADFVRLFLVDDTEEIYRRVTVNLDRLESFEVSTAQFNPVGPLRQTIQTHEQSIVTAQDNPLKRSHLLPSAVYAITVPLVQGDRLVGVVDIQTTHQSFSDIEQQVAQLIAYQAAQFIVQLRSNRALRDELEQRNLTLSSLRSRIKEVDSSRQLAGNWNTFLSQSQGHIRGYDFSNDAGKITPADQLSPEILDVLKQGEPYVQTTKGIHHISVPIQRSDEVLGAMAFELPPDVALTDRQIDLARSIAGRLAVAMDNRRLFEQSRLQAERERKASEIANQLISLTNVDTVLSEAAEAFNSALGAVGTQIHVQLTSEDPMRSLSQNGGS